MAEIRPFRGLRYSSEAGSLELLVAPPYDVLTPAERDEFAARNEYNVVHLTLPEQKPDDRSKFVKYARSAAALAEWRREGALRLEEQPAFYRYIQTFRITRAGDALQRSSIIALIKAEPYENGVVLPHEQTFSKHKEDRLRLLEATRAHLECIFGLFEDPDGAVHRAIVSAPVGSKVEVATQDGVHHVFEPITDLATTQELAGLLAGKKVWIADGHHRYETALAFRRALGEREGRIPEDYLMMALSSMSDPGLVLLPTHRIVRRLPYPVEQVLDRLAPHFDIAEMHSTRMVEELPNEGTGVFGLALEGGRGYILRPNDLAGLKAMGGAEGSGELRSLDVSILHNVIFEKLLDVHGSDGLAYSRDGLEAIRLADQGEAAAFVMNPPTVDDMKRIALGGEKMPQKSTFYYPKILSGLVMWSLNDFTP